MLGTETKVVIEFKQITEFSKEKSKSGIVADSIRMVMKNKTVHQFSNLFARVSVDGNTRMKHLN